MSKFVDIDKNFDPKVNFWKKNPQIAFLDPFNKLYKSDDGGSHSSSLMWACFFFCDPDEEINRLFRIDEENRIIAIENYYPDLDWDDPLFQEVLEAYPFECLTSIERALKEEKDSLRARAKLLRETPYTIDEPMRNDMGEIIPDKSGRPIIIKGTATQLDNMRGKTQKIYEALETTLDKFLRSKEESARVYGGREETLSEKGLI